MSVGRDDGKRGEESFLGRWSSRKRRSDAVADRSSGADRASDGIDVVPDDTAVARVEAAVADASAGTPPDHVSRPIGARSGDAPDIGSDGDPEPLLTDADMPPIESLGPSSDLSAFFGRGVSAALRRAALRHVFAQPAYNVRDGLNDYDGDFTVFEPLGDTITSDMKFHAARHERARLERERLAEAEAPSTTETCASEEEDEAIAEGAAVDGDTEAAEATAVRDGRSGPADGTADAAPAGAPPAGALADARHGDSGSSGCRAETVSGAANDARERECRDGRGDGGRGEDGRVGGASAGEDGVGVHDSGEGEHA